VIEALACRPAIKGACIGCVFVRRDAVLAHRKSVVTVVAQDLSDSAGRGRHAAIPAREACRSSDVRKPRFMHRCAVAARQESRACRSADGACVEVCIAQAIVGQSVKGGSLDHTAERGGSAIAYIVDENPDHVRRPGRGLHRLRPPLFRFCEGSSDNPLVRLCRLCMQCNSCAQRKHERRCQRLQYALVVHKAPVSFSHLEMTR